MEYTCHKCGKEGKLGAYIIDRALTLCSECGPKWIEMRQCHVVEEAEFLIPKKPKSCPECVPLPDE